MTRYLLNLLLVLDITLNVLLCGSPYQTLSSRCATSHPRLAAWINALFQDPRHCSRALASAGAPDCDVPVGSRVWVWWVYIVIIALIIR
jgi:hypothetical protein